VQLVISAVFVFSDLAAPMNGLFVYSYHSLQQFNTWFKLHAADRKSPPEGLFTQVLPLLHIMHITAWLIFYHIGEINWVITCRKNVVKKMSCAEIPEKPLALEILGLIFKTRSHYT